MRYIPAHLVKESLGSLGLEAPSISSVFSEVWNSVKNMLESNHLLGSPFVGSSPHDVAPPKKIEYIIKGDPSLPSYYNTRDEFPECKPPIYDQGLCGACWAFVGAGMLSDRLCIHSEGRINVALSP
jgi:C1A family cysteine protease